MAKNTIVLFWFACFSHGRRTRNNIDPLHINTTASGVPYVVNTLEELAPGIPHEPQKDLNKLTKRAHTLRRYLLAFQQAVVQNNPARRPYATRRIANSQGLHPHFSNPSFGSHLLRNDHRQRLSPQFMKLSDDEMSDKHNNITIVGEDSHMIEPIANERHSSLDHEKRGTWWRSLACGAGVVSLVAARFFMGLQRRGVQLMSALRWWIPVVALVLQNTGLILTMRYSRLTMTSSGAYLASSAVACSEVLKFVASLFVSLMVDSHWDVRKQTNLLKQEIIEKYDDMLKLSIPAFLYMIQNNLQYVATTNLSAPLCQVLYQLKLLTTALFSVILLRRRLNVQQWASLLTLTLGVGAVQYSQMAASVVVAGTFNLVGVTAVLCACLTSGLAGAIMELLLKTAKHSVWMRSLQFSVLGFLMSSIACIKDAPIIATNGFFGGFTPIVWTVVALQAFGGLMVALVVKNADNLVKGFATSLSILLSCALSNLFFGDLVLHPMLFFGAGAVVASTYWFGSCSTSSDAPSSWVGQRVEQAKDKLNEFGILRRLMRWGD